jgi:hypothetical protein
MGIKHWYNGQLKLIGKQTGKVISLVILILAGFYTKFYQGPGALWVHQSLGGLFYVIFWCVLVSLIFPGIRHLTIVIGVFLFTSLLEFLQLWHPNFLEVIRGTFPGAVILGTTFSLLDFVYYIVGSLLSWIWLNILNGND